MTTTKLYYLRELLLPYLEPNDIVDKFSGTGMFENVGIQIRNIQEKDDMSRRHRVEFFLQWFENLDPEKGNKCQELVDVLDADYDYKWLVPFLKEHELDPQFIQRLKMLQKPDKVKRILQFIFPALTDINVEDVMHQMHGVLNPLDREEISRVVERSGNHHALYIFLHKVIYKPPDWIKTFIDAVDKLNYNAATPMFEGTEHATLADALRDYFDAWNELGSEGTTEDRMDFEEGAEPMLERAACPVRSTESQMRGLHVATPTFKESETSDNQASCKPIHGDVTVTEPINDKLENALYGYQKELCKQALTNDSPSVVICAPTGSGKTIVAAHIIDQHLMGNRDGKVAFFTPNGGLAEQQCLKMEKYMPERNARKTIVMLRGNMENDIGKDFPRKIYSSDLIVMTPQILLNCLKNKAVGSIFDFSMMIFDECHHARASHPYSEILKKYLEDKGKKKNTIQIIGLTATLGIGSAEDEEGAKENIFRLLGILNATGGIVTVRDPKNYDELYDKCPAASESTEYITHDEEKDPFKDVIKGAISAILDFITNIKVLTELKIPAPVGHTGTLGKEFEGWCQKLRVAAEGRVDGQVGSGEEAKVSTLGRDTKSCAETLLRLKRAHDLCRNCQPPDAIHQIELFVSNRFKEHHEKNTELEKKVHGFLNSTIEKLKKCVEDAENKMLSIIEEKIKQKQHEDPDFRCMIMVSRRLYAAYLQKWIEGSKLLKELGASIYIGIGTKSTSELPGMTHKKQSVTIDGFKKGLYKVLVCTPDAAGEGIDVALCNLVVTIDCVRDEVRRIQLRGRARKQNSEVLYILFGNDGTMKDSLPLKKQLLMEQTTRRIEKMYNCNQDEYKMRLLEGRQKATGQMDATQMKRRSAPVAQAGRRDSFLCRGCSEYICCTDLLIRMNGNHHTVHDKRFRSKYDRTRHDSKGGFCGTTKMRHVNRIQCAKCKCDWGNEVAWKEYLVPIIGIRGFKIKDSRGKVHLPSKWKNTRLKIPELKNKDLWNELFEKCNGAVDESGDCAT